MKNNDLSGKVDGFTEGTYTAVTGLAYDATNKKLGIKVGADAVIPFSGGKTVKYIGQGTSFDIKSLFPDQYQNLTADNFLCEPISNGTSAENISPHGYEGSWYYSTYSFSKSYNASTGILTVTSQVYYNVSFAQYTNERWYRQQVKAYVVL